MKILASPESRPFLEDGIVVVHRLRRALGEALVAAQAKLDEPQEMSRRFSLDKTLTWRIARLVAEDDAWEAIAHIPRRPSMRILTDALARHGAPDGLIDGINQALDDFDRFVELHSGDRETLEIMASVVSKRTAQKRLEVFRRDGYLANSATWGVRADVQLGAKLIMPGEGPGRLDIATVAGLAGFRRLRMNVLWTITTHRIWGRPGDTPDQSALHTQAIDPAVPSGEVPLLSAFCSQPLPPIRAFEHGPATRRYMLEGSEIGNTACADIFLGWVSRGFASQVESYPGEQGEHGVVLSTPTIELVHDLYIHRSLPFVLQPDAVLYSHLPGGPDYSIHGAEAALELPVPRTINDLGVGLPDGSIPAIPRYREMISTAAHHLGYALTDFRAFRYRLSHPPIPSLALLRHSLIPREDVNG